MIGRLPWTSPGGRLPFVRRLIGDPGLLEEVGLNIPSSHLAHVVEPHTDKLSLRQDKVIIISCMFPVGNIRV